MLLSESELRPIVVEAVGRAAPSGLRDRLQLALRSGHTKDAARVRRRNTYVEKANEWAARHLFKSPNEAESIDAFQLFVWFARSPQGQYLGLTQDARLRFAKPTMFYRALESAGFVFSHDGARMKLEGTLYEPNPL